MLFVALAVLVFLYAHTHERPRQGYVEALFLITAVGVIGSIIPAYPILAATLYVAFLRKVLKAKPWRGLRFEKIRLVSLLPLLGVYSDYDALTYFIPQAYHLIRGGGIFYDPGLYDPQNPGMSSIAAFLLLPDYYLGTPVTTYVYSLRLLNVLTFFFLLDFLEDVGIKLERFLLPLLALPVFEMYVTYKASYADLTVAFLILALFYSAYEVRRLVPIAFSTLVLIKYLRPFVLFAFLLLLLPERFYVLLFSLPALALLRHDAYGFLFLSISSLALIRLRSVKRPLKDFIDRHLGVPLIRRTRETILFGRPFGVYGAYGTLVNRNFLRPERFLKASSTLSRVRSNVEQYGLKRFLSLTFGPIVLASVFFYAATHAPIGSKAAGFESAAILAGILQAAITHSIVTRQFLYLFIALSIAIARTDYRRVPSIASAYYVYVYLELTPTVRPVYPSIAAILLVSLFVMELLRNRMPKPPKRLIYPAISVMLVVPVAYHALAYYGGFMSASNSELLEIAQYIRSTLPEGALVITPGLIRGIGTFLKGYRVMNVLDVAERYGLEDMLNDTYKALERLRGFPGVALIIPTPKKAAQYYARISETFSIALIASVLASADEYKHFDYFSVVIAKDFSSGIAMFGYTFMPNVTTFVLYLQPGFAINGADIPRMHHQAFAVIVGENVSEARFYFYIPLIEGGAYVGVEANVTRLGFLRIAYLDAISYVPVGFSAVVDGRECALGKTSG